MFQNLKGKKIILASQSPRRRELLKGLDIDFIVKIKNDIDESFPEQLKREEIALFLCEHKANAFRNEIDANTIVITADTIVCIDDDVLNKPFNYDEAKLMLRKLSGREHTVITGVCIQSIDKKNVFYDATQVRFKEFTDDEIKFYLDNYKPYDKAGAYGAQEWIGYVGIESLTGSYFNVMGFPVHKVYKHLHEF